MGAYVRTLPFKIRSLIEENHGTKMGFHRFSGWGNFPVGNGRAQNGFIGKGKTVPKRSETARKEWG